MGIPRLKNLLEPYASPTGSKVEPCQAVIDGPALAYHILGLCSNKTKRSSPFELPPYHLLSRTVVAWLNQIETYGLSVYANSTFPSPCHDFSLFLTHTIRSAIFFDGLLPKSKQEERMQRVIAATKQHHSYHLANYGGVPRRRPDFDPDAAAVELFPKTRGKSTKGACLGPSFLVPAVIDALKESVKYAGRTRVVPGEADGFCAEYARLNGGVVLTSDSDLLIHDLGRSGTVIFLSDININSEEGYLTAPRFCIDRICERLSLKPSNGLAEVAFELVTDPHLTIEQAAQRAKGAVASSATPEEYEAFLKSYLFPETAPEEKTSENSARLDPRVSELTLRCISVGGSEEPLNNPPENEGTEFAVYLPHLLDLPVRTSAWEASKRTRQLAYTLLRLVRGAPLSSVSEFRRPQSRSSGVQMQCLSTSELEEECAALLDKLSRIQADMNEPDLVWMLLSLYEDTCLCSSQGKAAVPSLGLLRQYAVGALDQGSWDFIHFLSQVQASMYSLRMFKQILDFSTYHGLKDQLPEAVTDLGRQLSSLPPLIKFPSPPNFAELFRAFEKGNGLNCLAALLSGEDEAVQRQLEAVLQAPAMGRKGKKTKKRKVSASDAPRPGPPSRNLNPFDVLAGCE